MRTLLLKLVLLPMLLLFFAGCGGNNNENQITYKDLIGSWKVDRKLGTTNFIEFAFETEGYCVLTYSEYLGTIPGTGNPAYSGVTEKGDYSISNGVVTFVNRTSGKIKRLTIEAFSPTTMDVEIEWNGEKYKATADRQ